MKTEQQPNKQRGQKLYSPDPSILEHKNWVMHCNKSFHWNEIPHWEGLFEGNILDVCTDFGMYTKHFENKLNLYQF